MVDIVNYSGAGSGMNDAIASIRSFNRFYTQLAGALDARFLGSEATLPEARLLFEIAVNEPGSANALQASLGMDAGYVSRILTRFEKRGWIIRDRGSDARTRPIRLTKVGRDTFALLDARQRDAVAGMIARLDPVAQSDLVDALARARLLLDAAPTSGFTIRPFRTGDMGRIAARQSILYADSHGWGHGLEVVEGEVTSTFLRDFKPGREQCWVAEIDGVMAGSIFLTDEGSGIARLRLLYVEPFARGRRIGDALVATCIGFAQDKGYATLNLWTQAVLKTARRLYTRHGFERIETAVHHDFGEPVVGEQWQLRLATPSERETAQAGLQT
jgi:DNA-binding MarR family transcriptional regulator/N-acetylglutamate synthase-like GNAT family acetyltransferase